ncbi:tyrosine-type recombinase/integrase [Neorhizobium sp. P12A]|uniref:tyrosine-type recombinase/integrase n=1 Tax=Neorhizobium sp. P12A TaxID=2268027 RepID=UPI00165E01A5|nr:tyrosine-type recombinase/integrase [Neorhizobium sp. P12A]
MATIVSAEVRQMGIEVFPGCKAATINRQALTPARAILNHAHELGWCSAIRVRSFKTEKPIKLPAVNGEWMSKFISQADADGLYHLSAIVFFMQDCAARVSEACNVLGEHVDIRNKTIRLAKTKTETNATAYLTDECAYRIAHLPMKEGERVFRYSSRWSVNDRIAAVCRRAQIEYRPSHTLGRRTYATRAIKLGVPIKVAMDGGRWKTPAVFLGYVDIDNAGRIVAEKINSHRYANL